MVINQIRSLSVRPWENKAVFKQCKYAGRLPTWSYELVMGREVGSKEQCQLTQKHEIIWPLQFSPREKFKSV